MKDYREDGTLLLILVIIKQSLIDIGAVLPDRFAMGLAETDHKAGRFTCLDVQLICLVHVTRIAGIDFVTVDGCLPINDVDEAPVSFGDGFPEMSSLFEAHVEIPYRCIQLQG